MLTFLILFCTNKDNPVSTDTHNNIWLLDISPGLDKVLTLKDTIKIKLAYSFDPEQIKTTDSIFDVFMIFKRSDEPIGEPVYYSSSSTDSKRSKKWSDTITLVNPVNDLFKSAPQLKPFQFSFEMLTGGNCPVGKSGICFNTLYAQEYYVYKNGLDTLK